MPGEDEELLFLVGNSPAIFPGFRKAYSRGGCLDVQADPVLEDRNFVGEQVIHVGEVSGTETRGQQSGQQPAGVFRIGREPDISKKL